MKWLLLILALIIAASGAARAQGLACGTETGLAALLRCTEEAMLALSQDKRAQLEDEVARTAEKIRGDASRSAAPSQDYPDYGLEAAKALMADGGADSLIRAAREKSGALRYGRAEALLAMGTEAAEAGPGNASGLARRLNAELLSLARSAGDFERGDLAHAAAQLAAHRCDKAAFDQAMTMVMAPDAVRYEFWRARITGDRSGLPVAIIGGASADDTRHARQALEGIGMLADLGECSR
jgi:hypothetical protein